MSSDMVIIRHPAGGTEFRLGAADDLKVGDRVRRRRVECEVVDIHRDEHGHRVVTLRSLEEKATAVPESFEVSVETIARKPPDV